MNARRVVVLGSTGSVGRQAADVVREHPGEFEVVGLGAGGGNLRLLAEQIVEFRPETVAVGRAGALDTLRAMVSDLASAADRRARPFEHPKYLAGPDATSQLAAHKCDVVLNGITGAAGLPATLAALREDTLVALANKESLVVGGDLVQAEARPGQIVPVDSEHSAIAQALRSGQKEEVSRLLVTATGGPFRGRTTTELQDVTVEQALAHPKWSMGPVISINSATLANKGLEIIEAHLLFGIPFDRITVVVHPQAYIHSMVEFVDGSTIAQANPPDMRLPIALGLKWPTRIANVVPGIDWSTSHTWELSPLDERQSPMVAMARTVGELGGAAPAVYNAANEECVDAFVAGRIPFLGIPTVVGDVLDDYRPPTDSLSFDELMAQDTWARTRAGQIIQRRYG